MSIFWAPTPWFSSFASCTYSFCGQETSSLSFKRWEWANNTRTCVAIRTLLCPTAYWCSQTVTLFDSFGCRWMFQIQSNQAIKFCCHASFRQFSFHELQLELKAYTSRAFRTLGSARRSSQHWRAWSGIAPSTCAAWYFLEGKVSLFQSVRSPSQ